MYRSTPYHLVDNSPWPIVRAGSFFFVVSFLFFLFQKIDIIFFFPFVFLIFLCFFWWRDVIREASFLGFHNSLVQRNLLTRIIWFISSEVFFFFGFFWAFFHSSLGVCVDLFLVWPPIRVEVLNPLRVPLLNTVVLLSSRVTVTWAHYSLFLGDLKSSFLRIIYTIILRLFFTFLQYLEYIDSRFIISDSIYRSIFFIATRFHGFHVIVRSLFLLVSCVRIYKGHFTPKQHVGLECSIWYWHFVDVVWVFLYISIYWWGSTFYFK